MPMGIVRPPVGASPETPAASLWRADSPRRVVAEAVAGEGSRGVPGNVKASATAALGVGRRRAKPRPLIGRAKKIKIIILSRDDEPRAIVWTARAL